MPYTVELEFKLLKNKFLHPRILGDFSRYLESKSDELSKIIFATGGLPCHQFKIKYEYDFTKHIKSFKISLIGVPEDKYNLEYRFQSDLSQRIIDAIKGQGMDSYYKLEVTSHVPSEEAFSSQLSKFFSRPANLQVNYKRDYFGANLETTYIPR